MPFNVLKKLFFLLYALQSFVFVPSFEIRMNYFPPESYVVSLMNILNRYRSCSEDTLGKEVAEKIRDIIYVLFVNAPFGM